MTPTGGIAELDIFDLATQNCHDGYGASNTLAYTYTIEYIEFEGDSLKTLILEEDTVDV